MDRDGTKTSSRRGRSGKSVSHSELATDSVGKDKTSGRGCKRKQSQTIKRKRLKRGEGDPDAGKINWDEIELDVPEAEMTAEKERRIEYRKVAEIVHKYLKAVDNLKLPPNPLDKLLNELGGKCF